MSIQKFYYYTYIIIYIFFLFKVVRFNKFHVKDGKNTKGRFGLSLASLGDINNDGYGGKTVFITYK